MPYNLDTSLNEQLQAHRKPSVYILSKAAEHSCGFKQLFCCFPVKILTTQNGTGTALV